MTDEPKQVTATVSVESVIKALEYNDTIGADDRVIRVPQRDGAEASVRRAFQGSERYANPSTAPVHLRPETLVEDAWSQPPRRSRANDHVRTEHNLGPDTDMWPEEYQRKADEVHEEQVDMWRQGVAGMIAGERLYMGMYKGVEITLVGERTDE
jgi:hypothetical protein